MTPERLRTLLERVASGETTSEAAMEELRLLAFEELEFAKIDHHRGLRRGFPEVVFGPGKEPAHIASIAERLAAAGHTVLVTKTTRPAFDAVRERTEAARWHERAGAIVIGDPPKERHGRVVVLSGGTSDLAIAEEAALTSELMGSDVESIVDVGVAGLHRLLAHREALSAADVLVVVAGMEGALPSVVSGLTDVPVVAVPTSVGYGASFAGLAALLAMLNGCSPGVGVVNIDNGFGAGYLASMIGRSGRDRRS